MTSNQKQSQEQLGQVFPSYMASINEPPGSRVVPPEADAPTITSLTPSGCAIGDADFTLTVAGTGFTEDSVIYFAGHDEPTTHETDGTVSTGIKPSLWASPVVVQCQVRNGATLSNAVDFTFTEAAASRGRHQDHRHQEQGKEKR